MTNRIHEYPLDTAARLASAFRWLGIGIAVGCGAGFLLALGATITVNEAFIDVWYDVDLDPLSRMLIPLLMVAFGLGLVVFAVGDAAYRWLLGRQLARAAAATPQLVPPHWQREFVGSASPLGAAVVAIWVVFGLALLAAIIFFAILGETSDDDVEFVTGTAVGALLLAATMVAMAVVAHGPAKRRWVRLVGGARAAWGRQTVRIAEEADRARRPRGEKVGPSPATARLLAVTARLVTIGTGSVILGTAIGFLGVAIRQPCRRCDPISYDTVGEAIIDNLAVIGFSVTVLGILVLIVAGSTATVSGLITDAALRASASGLDAQRRPAGSLLQQRLTRVSLREAYSILASGIGAIAATAAVSVAIIDFPVDTAIRDAVLVGGIALLAIAPVLAYTGVGYNLRLRSQLRERWAPADVPVVRMTASKR